MDHKLSFIAFALMTSAPWVHADGPSIYMQNATLSGANEAVTVERVPVKTASGKLVYKDITTVYVTDGNGNLAIAAGYPIVEDSKNLQVGAFKAGTYTTTVAGKTYSATLGGPGVGPDGSTSWSFLSNFPGNGAPFLPVSANWYVTKNLKANPEYARLNAAGITSPAYSYGAAGSSSYCTGVNYWVSNSLVGASQTGNSLTINSFTNGCNGGDKNFVTDSTTWILQAP